MCRLKFNKCCLVGCVSVFATALILLSTEYIFFKKEIDTVIPTRSISVSDIKTAKILHVKQAAEKRKRYEGMINTKFGGELFGVKTSDLTMDGTYGKTDLVFMS